MGCCESLLGQGAADPGERAALLGDAAKGRGGPSATTMDRAEKGGRIATAARAAAAPAPMGPRGQAKVPVIIGGAARDHKEDGVKDPGLAPGLAAGAGGAPDPSSARADAEAEADEAAGQPVATEGGAKDSQGPPPASAAEDTAASAAEDTAASAAKDTAASAASAPKERKASPDGKKKRRRKKKKKKAQD